MSAAQKTIVALELLPELEAEAKKRQAHGETAPGKTLTPSVGEAYKSRHSEAVDAAAAIVGVCGSSVSAFPELYMIGKDGWPLKRAPAMKAITAEHAERERQRLIAANYTCWECCGPVHRGAWLMVLRICGYPAAFLVCTDCVDRVRRRRSGLRMRWFEPKGAK